MANNRARFLVYVIVSILALLAIVYFFGIRPNQQLNNAKQSLTTKEFIELKGLIRTGLAQALGGAALLIGLVFSWRSIKTAEKNLAIAQQSIASTQETAAKNIAITLDGQITDRFTKAITQLADDKSAVRLGGIYALERIAKDSERDHLPIMEILTAYVRENASWKEPPQAVLSLPQDIQALLTVMGRRTLSFEKGKDAYLDLRSTDLRSANLSMTHFEDALFYNCHLERASLISGHFEGANFFGAHLQGVNFSDADLEDTSFFSAHLEGAVFNLSRARGANFVFAEVGKTSFMNVDLDKASFLHANAKGADFEKASLVGVSFMNADLDGANLREANMREADLVGATMKDADLDHADLSTANGITVDAILSTFGYGSAKLPEHIQQAIKEMEQKKD